MVASIDKRLQQLRVRRDGSVQTLLTAPKPETWEFRGRSNQPSTRYALGALQAVSADYTRVSIETANRITNQLSKAGLNVEFRLQGSVPLDVHIKGISDVDLLALEKRFLTYHTAGTEAKRGYYKYPAPRTSVEALLALRRQIEPALQAAFPSANVDMKGSKAVKISGGSLARSVDVVPSHWLDTISYQDSDDEIDRGVYVLDLKKMATVENHPFLHIALIKYRCDQVSGGLRKAIRLCKNVKADSDSTISLPSFDISAVMYHANLEALKVGRLFELSILSETQRHLDNLACNHDLASALLVPDGSRKIFDTTEKLQGLNELSKEMDEILKSVYAENTTNQLATGSLNDMRDLVCYLTA